MAIYMTLQEQLRELTSFDEIEQFLSKHYDLGKEEDTLFTELKKVILLTMIDVKEEEQVQACIKVFDTLIEMGDLPLKK